MIKGTSTPGTFFSFVTALLLIYDPVRNLSTSYQDIQEGLAGAVRVFQVLDSVPKIQDKESALALPPVKGAVSFRSVSFGYDQHLVLHDIGLEVRPGEIIAIVGTTGAGKTTLVNLVPRFYDVTRGAIVIDGFEYRRYYRALAPVADCPGQPADHPCLTTPCAATSPTVTLLRRR